MATTPLIVYDDFRGGDWGNKGSKLAAKNEFRALNMLVYRDGQVGPRPGVVRWTAAYPPVRPQCCTAPTQPPSS